jgi:5-methylcytosine-specific restriction protein A
MELIESINEAAQNAEEFNQIQMDSDSETLRRFSQFFHWYYFSNLDVFAPSKFIGYKNTTIDNYAGRGTGTDTQRVLSNWFTKVDSLSSEYVQLSEKLKAYGRRLGKSIGKKTFEGTGGIYLLSERYATSNYPDEVEGTGYAEGATKQVAVNTYERSSKARLECISHYGASCYVCGFDFSKVYGSELGAGFIHVHHLVDIASIRKEYIVNAIQDLRPLCPNCHAMIHKIKPAMNPDELKRIVAENVHNKAPHSDGNSANFIVDPEIRTIV